MVDSGRDGGGGEKIDGKIKLNHELSEYTWFDPKKIIANRLKMAYNQQIIMKDFYDTQQKRG